MVHYLHAPLSSFFFFFFVVVRDAYDLELAGMHNAYGFRGRFLQTPHR